MNFYKKLILEISVLVFVIFGISSITTNYLFFHVVAELFSIIIMCLLFAVTMNGQKFIDNRYLLFVGSSGIFIGALDLLHTLTFDGMNIIVSPHFYANQFWVATRFLKVLCYSQVSCWWLIEKQFG